MIDNILNIRLIFFYIALIKCVRINTIQYKQINSDINCLKATIFANSLYQRKTMQFTDDNTVFSNAQLNSELLSNDVVPRSIKVSNERNVKL